MKYRIIIPENVKKKILKFGEDIYNRIDKKLEYLSINPNIGKRMEGFDVWSLRVGKYRIIYTKDDGVIEIWVIDVDKRSKVYRRFIWF